MDFLLRCLPIVLVASTLAQYEGFEGNGYPYHGAHHQLDDQQHQSLDDHGEEYELDYHAHPKYSFDYSVKDPHTGDDKEHWETRDGDKVKGTYTLLETDGTKRVVEYEADDKNGFNAVVHKIGTPKHVEQQVYHKAPEYHKEEPEYHQREYHHQEPAYHVKPAHEPVAYGHDYGQFEDGFVPSFGH